MCLVIQGGGFRFNLFSSKCCLLSTHLDAYNFLKKLKDLANCGFIAVMNLCKAKKKLCIS